MKRLVNLKYIEGHNITKHTSKFQGLVDQLTIVKIILDDELQAPLLLSSLLDSWETLVFSVNNSASNGKLNFNMVIDRLRDEKSRRKSIEATLSELNELVLGKKVGEKPK